MRRYSIANALMGSQNLTTGILRTRSARWIVIPESASTWAFPFGLKEPAVQFHLKRLLKDADAFVDCGANLGWYSLLASGEQQVKRIIAIEPIYQSVRYLQQIRKLNGIKKLEVIRGCVSNRDGEVLFCNQPGRFSEMGSVKSDSGNGSGTVLSRQPSFTLETILKMVDSALKRVCIKIDVEGHEATVLESVSAKTLSERVQSVLVEVHLYKFSDPERELEKICELLSHVGPVRFLLTSPELHPAYQRFWQHLTSSYPLADLNLDAVKSLVRRRSLGEIYVVAQNGI